MVNRLPYLTKNRYQVYYFRMVFPVSIRSIPSAPKEIRLSLETKSSQIALDRYLDLYQSIRILVLSFHSIIQDKQGINDMSEVGKTLKDKLQDWKQKQRFYDQLNERDDVIYQLRKERLALKRQQEEQAQELTKEKARAEQYRGVAAAYKERASTQPATIPATPAGVLSNSQITLEALVEEFLAFEQADSTNKEKTKKARRNYLYRFLDIVGYRIPLCELTHEHINHYSDVIHLIPKNFEKQGFDYPEDKHQRPDWFRANIHTLEGDKLSGEGISSTFKHPRELFRWAKKKRFFQEDLSDMLETSEKRKKETKKEAIPFSPDQLTTLFIDGYLYNDVKRSREQPKDWHFWVPLIGLTTGMRSSEIGELEISDFVEIEGFWCINVDETKSEAGARFFPIPQRLIDAGLLDYREQCIQRPHRKHPNRLFPDMNLKTKESKYSDTIGRFFNVPENGYMKRMEVESTSEKERLSFHSLRHNAVTALLHTKLDRTGEPTTLEVIKNIVGHGLDFAKTYGIDVERWRDVTTFDYNHRDRIPLQALTDRLHDMKEALDNADLQIDLSGVHYNRFKKRKKPSTIKE